MRPTRLEPVPETVPARSCPLSMESRTHAKRWGKYTALVVFAFFFIKGLVWLAVAVAAAWFATR